MRTASYLFLLCSLLCGAPAFIHAGPTSPVTAQTQAAFGGDCETLINTSIREARREIVAAVFTFTRHEIASELIAAARRGVKVHVKVDAKQAEWEGMAKVIKRMQKAGVTVTLISMQRKRSHMHHKFIVIDDRLVVTGSYNYTTSATTANHENVVRIVSRTMAQTFREAFDAVESPATKPGA